MAIFGRLTLFAFATTLCAVQFASNSIEAADSPSTSGLRRISCTAIVDRIYRDIFENQTRFSTRPWVESKLNEAFKYLKNPAYVYDSPDVERAAKVRREIELFYRIANDDFEDCSYTRLEKRLELEDLLTSHSNLGHFIQYYNGLLFLNCAQKLVGKLNQGETRPLIRAVEPLERVAIKKVAKLVLTRRERLMSRGEYDSDEEDLQYEDPLRNTAIVVVRYLEAIGLDLVKPTDRTMHQHIEYINRIIHRIFFNECQHLGQLYGPDYKTYLLMLKYDSLILKPVFERNEIVQQLLEQMRICQQLTEATPYIYPLGRFDMETLMDKLDEQASGSSTPEHFRDSLDEILHLGTAELYLGNDYSQTMRYYLDLFVISQIDRRKCVSNYFKILKRYTQANLNLPSTMNYIKHYAHLQVLQCLPIFKQRMRHGLARVELEDSMNLQHLYDIFKSIAQQVEPNIRLYYDNISYTILRLASGKIFDFFGLNLHSMFEQGNEQLVEKLPETQEHIHNLFKSCRFLMSRIETPVDMIRLFIAVDPSVTDQLENSNLLNWLSKYNICKTLLKLQTVQLESHSSIPLTHSLDNLNISGDQ